MKIRSFTDKHASVLIVALLTITIMTLICATSLFITTQNTGGGMQTSGWQQALTAAEAGIDAGVRALNATASSSPSPWASWKVVPYSSPASSYTLPSVEPTATATPAAAGTPDSTHYNYLPSSQCAISFPNTEGATSVSAWVTVDKVGPTNLLSSGNQWYRIRSTGQTTYPSNSTILTRVSNNRLDSDLRNTIGMHFSRKGSGTLGPTRTIEVIVQPAISSIWGQGILLQHDLDMSGGGVIDHFNSNTTSTTTFLTSPSTYRSTNYTETLVGMNNANTSDLKSTYVYGAIDYSTTGTVPANTSHVQGGLTSPFQQTPPAVSDPTWTPDITYTTGSGNAPANISPGSNNNAAHPYKVKENGNFTVPGGATTTFNYPNSGSGTVYVEVWVTGNFTTSGSGYITEQNNIHVTYYIDGTVTVSGQSIQNQSGLAQNNQFVVVGSGSVTVSGSGNFIGTLEAPNSAVTISGSGSLTGAVIANTLNISGGASFHYDDSLATYGSGGTTIGAYSFASWFEDNSDPGHKDINGNYVVY